MIYHAMDFATVVDGQQGPLQVLVRRYSAMEVYVLEWKDVEWT